MYARLHDWNIET
jgi:hypothetical protein